MTKIIYYPQYRKSKCSNCSAIMTGDIERVEFPDYQHKSIVHITPCRCSNCGEYFSDVEISIDEEI